MQKLFNPYKIALFLIGSSLFSFHSAKSQDVIYISEEGIYQLLRVNLAMTTLSMKPVDSSRGYRGYGIHLSNETKIISGKWDVNKKFTIHDGFYFDMSFGLGKRDEATKSLETPRGRGVGTVNMGYFCLAGYRVQPYGILGGIDFRWRRAGVFKLTMPNVYGPILYSSFPLVLRLEKGLDTENPNRRLALMLSSTISSKKRAPYQSAKIEYGLSDNGRWNLFLQYINQKALAEDTYKLSDPAVTRFNQVIFGLRVGNLP